MERDFSLVCNTFFIVLDFIGCPEQENYNYYSRHRLVYLIYGLHSSKEQMNILCIIILIQKVYMIKNKFVCSNNFYDIANGVSNQ